MDLLGYGEVVSRCWNNKDLISKIKKCIEHSLKVAEQMWMRPGVASAAAKQHIRSQMNVRLVSDSLLVTMSLSNAPLLDPKLSGGETSIIYIEAVIMTACMLYLYISGYLGHLFRGAITVGQYVEDHPVKSDNWFIFSKALVDAVSLEKGASYPRVLIGQSVDDFIARIDKTDPLQKDGWVYIDKGDAARCLNIYAHLDDYKSRPILQSIRDAVQGQIQHNQQRIEIVRKYQWFKNYHNQWLADKPHFQDLAIPT